MWRGKREIGRRKRRNERGREKEREREGGEEFIQEVKKGQGRVL